jgi:hypothetical protein
MVEKLDMVDAQRVPAIKEPYWVGHQFGNALLTGMVQRVFGNRFADMLSGALRQEPPTRWVRKRDRTDVHALALRMPTAEVPTPYKDRPA